MNSQIYNAFPVGSNAWTCFVSLTTWLKQRTCGQWKDWRISMKQYRTDLVLQHAQMVTQRFPTLRTDRLRAETLYVSLYTSRPIPHFSPCLVLSSSSRMFLPLSVALKAVLFLWGVLRFQFDLVMSRMASWGPANASASLHDLVYTSSRRATVVRRSVCA